jgi:WD40 repeat protein
MRPEGGAVAPRLREYFPETLLWQPALVTDERGAATLPLTFADSITTWRLTASASSRSGLLGGVSAPLRVFQDFFVDLDLPVALTQNDEVAFPVAVYNYLKGPQAARLALRQEPWFELADGGGLSRSIHLKAGEVTSIKFRIRARRIGHFPLTVKATGSKMSDAVNRGIDVLPDGRLIVSRGHDGTVRVWDAATGQEKLSLQGNMGSVSGVAFSPDGRRIATWDRKGTVQVWDATTGQEMLYLTGHTDSVYRVAFSPDGQRIVSASNDGTVKIWDGAPLVVHCSWTVG